MPIRAAQGDVQAVVETLVAIIYIAYYAYNTRARALFCSQFDDFDRETQNINLQVNYSLKARVAADCSAWVSESSTAESNFQQCQYSDTGSEN